MKVKLTVPDSLEDIKLSQYQKFIRTTKDSEDVAFINRQAVAIFCNLTDKLVLQLRSNDFENLVNKINDILNSEGTFKQTFSYKGVKYGFIPNLEEITVGEQADADSFISDVKDWDKLMKVIYRPITFEKKGKYEVEDYTGEEPELDLPLSIAIPAVNFFLNTLNDLLNTIPNYIMEVVKADKRLLNLVENGDGIKTFTHSLKETFSSMKMLAS